MTTTNCVCGHPREGHASGAGAWKEGVCLSTIGRNLSFISENDLCPCTGYRPRTKVVSALDAAIKVEQVNLTDAEKDSLDINVRLSDIDCPATPETTATWAGITADEFINEIRYGISPPIRLNKEENEAREQLKEQAVSAIVNASCENEGVAEYLSGEGFDAGWNASRNQVIDEFVRQVDREFSQSDVFVETFIEIMRAVAEEMKGEK